MKFTIQSATSSNTGAVRTVNQDSAYTGNSCCVVADGMGGYVGGDIASSIAVTPFIYLDYDKTSQKNMVNKLRKTVRLAESNIRDYVRNYPKLQMMGTTVTSLFVKNNKAIVAHIGDSRAYLLHSNGEFEQITNDHTFVQTLINEGKLTYEESLFHPKKHVVTKALGDFDIDMKPDIFKFTVKNGDRFLLCSDGLSSFSSADNMQKILRETESPKKASEQLVKLALKSGSTDNITVIVVDIVPKPIFFRRKNKPKIAGAIANIASEENKMNGYDLSKLPYISDALKLVGKVAKKEGTKREGRYKRSHKIRDSRDKV
jgi:protein phosphatase